MNRGVKFVMKAVFVGEKVAFGDAWLIYLTLKYLFIVFTRWESRN